MIGREEKKSICSAVDGEVDELKVRLSSNLNEVSSLTYQATRLINELDEFDVELAGRVIEGLRKYSTDKNIPGFLVRRLTEFYKNETGLNYIPRISL